MTNLLLQLVSWNILYVLLVVELLNSFVYLSWLQHKHPLVLHGLQNLMVWIFIEFKISSHFIVYYFITSYHIP